MRVVRLEIQGFKSFKDKTVIHFDHSITGIVGPNGSGKSNIVDAFFWVMGEQSYKHMRGSGAEDLIFNGSSKYGPAGVAEATLVMETDVPDTESAVSGASAADLPLPLKTKEVSVTRRVYRSGEGEYFINGVPARLKDIHELFMDTGVGAKGYSVIEQGQIGKIVQAKPEDRRLIIEEAAGIAKYKARKKESLRKMEATQANLSRLTDVVQEIERNLGSLERQAQKARQYEKYRAELMEREMTWGRRKAQVLTDRIEDLRKQREGLEQELVGLRAELQVAENSIETERVDQVTDSKAAEELQTKIQTLAAELADRKSALELSRRRQGDLSAQLEQLEAERQTLETAIANDQERVQTQSASAEDAQIGYEAARERAESSDAETREARAALESARRALDDLKRKLMSEVSEASSLTSRAASLDGRLEAARSQLERAQSLRAELEAGLESARTEVETAKVMSEEARTRRETLREEKRTQQESLSQLEQSVRQSDRAREEAQRTFTQLKSRLQSLEELARAHEGFGEGPKAALEWAKSRGSDATLRALADAWDIDSGFEAALEGALENSLESLFTDNAATALGAFETLRSKKKGRARVFHPSVAAAAATTGASASDLEAALAKHDVTVVGPLAAHVRTNDRLGGDAAAIAARAVSRVFVVETLDAASLAAMAGETAVTGWTLVSRDGTAWDASTGCLRGGSAQSNEAGSLLGRKRAIAELQGQVNEAEHKYNESEETAQTARKSLEDARARLQSLQSEIQEAEVQAATLERDVQQMSRALRDSEQRLEQSAREAQHTASQVETLSAERSGIDEKLQGILSGRTELEDRISTDDEAVRSREESVREAESELQMLKVQEAEQRERAQSLKREIDGLRSVLADRERRLADIRRTLERASREQEQYSGGDGDLITTIENVTRDLADTQEALSVVKDRLEQGGSKLKSALSLIKKLHDTGEEKTSASNQLAIEVEKQAGELSHLRQNLEEKYGMGCLEQPVVVAIQEEMGNPVVTLEMTAEQEALLSEEVERLRERIRRLGEVNPNAVNEYEEVRKRHEYLSTERQDLLRSIDNLQEAIEHINRTSEDRFKKAFEAIAERFEKLFPVIFGGGQAKLSLVYPENSTDILEAGVEILAQPPGKKIVNIGLLSGGEKALTAVSLIFAIFMVKPSPFCLLDEVDAPLDDANIGKFNALLREMSVKSQFILITHNKKTMELNDTLYGVTMEEPGVSKVVSIEMR